jgi:hypothetical protein
MNGVSLEQFMQMRNSAASRMQASTSTQASASTASSTSATKSPAQDWATLLESKRREMGVSSATSATTATTTASVNRMQTSAYSVQAGNQSYQARAQELRSLAQQGVPVRSTGNLFDVRA